MEEFAHVGLRIASCQTLENAGDAFKVDSICALLSKGFGFAVHDWQVFVRVDVPAAAGGRWARKQNGFLLHLLFRELVIGTLTATANIVAKTHFADGVLARNATALRLLHACSELYRADTTFHD